MRRSLKLGLVAAIVACTALPASPAAAQTSLILGAGASTPNGDLADLVDAGFHGRVGLELSIPVFPVSLRADGALHRFSGKGAGAGTLTQLNGTLSAVLNMGALGVGPYFLGGLGKYRQDFSDDFAMGDPVTETGYHAGVGFKLGLLGVGAFAEARAVLIRREGGDHRYFPLTVGLRF